ncbi:hypothetical protein O7632_30545 [Solwaraspora sp. WMMD406]|nr:hypothetical protein [Solwaraspora sp. WMMD406]MDG4768400.1 hypothetical protein [Solwaraspora sp. WMMD406]
MISPPRAGAAGATLAGLGGELLVGVVAGGYLAFRGARLPPAWALSAP